MGLRHDNSNQIGRDMGLRWLDAMGLRSYVPSSDVTPKQTSRSEPFGVLWIAWVVAASRQLPNGSTRRSMTRAILGARELAVA